MPQSIYQGLTDLHTPQQRITLAPDGWSYIGETVQGYRPVWEKIRVMNRVGNSWVQLNAMLDRVDYMLKDLRHNQVTLEIVDHLNFDFLDYELTVERAGPVTVTTVLPDNTVRHIITGLIEETTYIVNLRARLLQGGWTNSSVQTFTTPKNPIPMAPINLRSSARTNSTINLEWANPFSSTGATFNVYLGTDSVPFTLFKAGIVGTKVLLTGLSEDRKYQYRVTGVNSGMMEGPPSNIIRWATGHEPKYRTGAINREPLFPAEHGSWRPDIGWLNWRDLWYHRRRTLEPRIYQGYWQKDPVWTGSTVGINRPEQETGRYRGIVTYNTADFRNRMAARFGAGVTDSPNFQVSLVEIRRVHREAGVGTAGNVAMEWHLTNTSVFDSAEPPPVYFGHRNTTNSADSVAAHDTIGPGRYIDFLRLPRGYGHALITGTGWYGPGQGVPVNGLMLYRGDHQNTGAGAAGYGRWLRHGAGSDWTVHISASWNFAYIGYLAPYQW